jgi:hypothetical protein
VRIDDKHLRSVDPSSRGRYCAIVTAKSRGDITFGPFWSGKTEGLQEFPGRRPTKSRALASFLESFSTPPSAQDGSSRGDSSRASNDDQLVDFIRRAKSRLSDAVGTEHEKIGLSPGPGPFPTKARAIGALLGLAEPSRAGRGARAASHSRTQGPASRSSRAVSSSSPGRRCARSTRPATSSTRTSR